MRTELQPVLIFHNALILVPHIDLMIWYLDKLFELSCDNKVATAMENNL